MHVSCSEFFCLLHHFVRWTKIQLQFFLGFVCLVTFYGLYQGKASINQHLKTYGLNFALSKHQGQTNPSLQRCKKNTWFLNLILWMEEPLHHLGYNLCTTWDITSNTTWEPLHHLGYIKKKNYKQWVVYTSQRVSEFAPWGSFISALMIVFVPFHAYWMGPLVRKEAASLAPGFHCQYLTFPKNQLGLDLFFAGFIWSSSYH